MKYQRKSDNRLVYSTNKEASLCPKCGEPNHLCECNKMKTSTGDGIVRIRREVKGRKGKTVTTISGIPLPETEKLASDLKRFCGTGGSVKNGMIIIQGDHRSKIKPWLEAKGFAVKLAGG